MKAQKILVCGATGFIGRNLVEYFSDRTDLELYGIYHRSKPPLDPRLTMLPADLTDADDVRQVISGMDIVIQAAATTSGAKDIVTRPYYHVTDNAVMNSLIFRAAHESNVARLIFFSCSVMYRSSDRPVKESDFDANREMHHNYFGVGWTKVYTEKMCEFYSRLGRTAYTVLRHSNIYGPYDKFDLERSHVFGATMTKVLTARKGKITVWGDGETARDLLYVSDLARCVDLALKKQEKPFELFNVGSGQAITVNDLVEKIIAHSGKNLTIEHDLSKPSIKTSLCLDTTRAGNKLGWKPRVSLDEGIRKTLEWYRAHILLNSIPVIPPDFGKRSDGKDV